MATDLQNKNLWFRYSLVRLRHAVGGVCLFCHGTAMLTLVDLRGVPSFKPKTPHQIGRFYHHAIVRDKLACICLTCLLKPIVQEHTTHFLWHRLSPKKRFAVQRDSAKVADLITRLPVRHVYLDRQKRLILREEISSP